jgi:hypothetical protein
MNYNLVLSPLMCVCSDLIADLSSQQFPSGTEAQRPALASLARLPDLASFHLALVRVDSSSCTIQCGVRFVVRGVQ